MEANDNFPQDVVELLGYFDDASEEAQIQAVAGQGTHVPVWILGSSLYGAQFAAYLGLPYAFASHFAPAMLEDATATYRSTFRPSQWLAKPYFMLAAGVCAAATDDEACYLRSSQIRAFANLRTGRPGKLPRPIADLSAEISAPVLVQVEQALSCSATGSPETVRRELAALVERYKPEEIMVTGMIHDHGARLRSFAIAAEALSDIAQASKAA
jgi:luciferase family oxidoreductase group 1